MSRRYSVVMSAWCLVLAAVTPLSAQSAEDAARAAEQAGQYRQAFTLYMARWKEVTADYDRSQSPAASQAIERIRDAIFNVIRNVDPPPAVPDEATAFEGRAEAANNVRDYADAAASALRQRSKAAPASQTAIIALRVGTLTSGFSPGSDRRPSLRSDRSGRRCCRSRSSG